jgi:hypothetical protein
VKILIEGEFGKVWMDGSSPIVFVQLIQPPLTDQSLDKLKATCKTIIKSTYSKYKMSYMVLDLSSFNQTLGFLQGFLDFVASDLKKFLSYYAIIKPSAVCISPSVAEIMRTNSLRSFETFEKAMQKLNVVRVDAIQAMYGSTENKKSTYRIPLTLRLRNLLLS